MKSDLLTLSDSVTGGEGEGREGGGCEGDGDEGSEGGGIFIVSPLTLL